MEDGSECIEADSHPAGESGVGHELERLRPIGLEYTNLIRTAGVRVMVFPELSLTGYELDAATIKLDDPALVRQQCYINGAWVDAASGCNSMV